MNFRLAETNGKGKDYQFLIYFANTKQAFYLLTFSMPIIRIHLQLSTFFMNTLVLISQPSQEGRSVNNTNYSIESIVHFAAVSYFTL